jgi:hypothetical protein
LICRCRGYVADVADLPGNGGDTGDTGDTGTSRDLGADVAGTSAELRHGIGASSSGLMSPV